MLAPTRVSQSLEAHARAKLKALAERDALRALRPGDGDARCFRHQGRSFVAFASNDYLGLSHHPEVVAAGQEALRAAGATASRLVVGDHLGYAPLEKALAALKGTEAACVFGSGYHANLGVIPALAGVEDVVFIDALAHACLFSGARLSRARVVVFPHDDVRALGELLRRERSSGRHALILTEGIFSMDGDGASLPELADLADAYDAWLLVDDAHATGVIGASGAGSASAAGLPANRVPLQIGTLSKALGGYGGFLCASRAVVDLMVTRARTLIYSTGLPPSVVAAASAALRVAEKEPWRRARAVDLARRVATALDLPEPKAAIVPVPIGGNADVMALHARLLARGLWVPAMRPPTVPEGTARLRISLSAAHSDDDVARLLDALRAEGVRPLRFRAASGHPLPQT